VFVAAVDDLGEDRFLWRCRGRRKADSDKALQIDHRKGTAAPREAPFWGSGSSSSRREVTGERITY